MKLSPNAQAILSKRYLAKDKEGKPIETIEGMFRRVAETIASAEKENPEKYAQEFYNLMTSLDFLPNSPTLMNAGRPLGQLSACFVLPIEDSMEGIYDALKYAALVHKSGGGTGFSFSRLRPINDIVQTTGGVASGPLSFLEVFNTSTEKVKQGGTRRGGKHGDIKGRSPRHHGLYRR